MAEIVEYRSEGMIPELETMLVLLFDKEDVKSITKRRREYEYKLQRPDKRKEDCIRYIDYEMKLMRMIKLRHKGKGLQKNAKLTNLEISLGRRLQRMFTHTIRLFPNDVQLWVSYIKFCSQMRFGDSVSRVLEQMLELHGSSNVELFKMAASLELELKCVEKARKYLLMGIHIHKENKMLLVEAFKLELIDADMKRQECLEKNMRIDPTNAHLTAVKAETIYTCSLRKLKDVELTNDLLSICSEYDFTNNLIKKINADLLKLDHDEKMWDIIATRELNIGSEKITPKNKIGKCVALYETAVKKLNTHKMWAFYIDTLVELKKETTLLPNYKRKLLSTALQKADSAGKLTEKYYLIWVKMLQEPEKHKKLVEVLQSAVVKLPESVTLWEILLKAHFTKGEERKANQVFEQALAALTTKSLPLWTLMLEFEQVKHNNKKVEELYKRSWTEGPEIRNTLMPLHLEWLVLTQSITAARKAYEKMNEIPPPCMALHQKMIYLEECQPNVSVKKIRAIKTIMCIQLGKQDADVWMDLVKFEVDIGDPSRVSSVYWKAMNLMDAEVFDKFLSQFTIYHTVPERQEKTVFERK